MKAGDQTLASYPDGTVFVQHLELPNQKTGKTLRLETKLLHFEDGEWRPYSYVWNDEGTDATLVDSIGANRTISWNRSSAGKAEERTWHIGAVNECKLCHNAGAGYVLIHAAPDYTTGLPVEALLDDDVIFAYEYEGAPLEPERGRPVRLVVPKRYFYKSAKWVTGMEYMTEPKLGFWERSGYSETADPWREERYS